MTKEINKGYTPDKVKQGKNNSVVLARFFMDEYADLAFDANRELFIYDPIEGIYNNVDDKKFDSLFMAFLTKNNVTDIWKLNRINEVKRAIHALDRVLVVEFDAYDNLICFKNCIINLDEMKKFDFSPEYYFTSRVNIDYDNTATSAPVFTKFLETTFTDNKHEPDSETINNILRIGGYLFYPQNRLELMFLFLGEGANGKSILITLFEMFFDQKNVSYLDLDTLSSKSLERESLIGSRLNTTTEAKSSKMDSEMIKKVISSEGLEVTRKNRKSIKYIPTTKLVVASNTQPYFNDTSHGIYRRLFPITFRNRFVSPQEYEITHMAEAKRIFVGDDKKEIINGFKLEISGILNLFIGGLNDLRNKKWQLKMSENSETTLSEYKNSGDSVTQFLTEFFEEDIDKDWIGVAVHDIYHDYREWYHANVAETALKYGIQALGKKIKDMWRIEPFRKETTNGKRATFYPLKRKLYANRNEIQTTTASRINGDQSEAIATFEAEVSQGKLDIPKQQAN